MSLNEYLSKSSTQAIIAIIIILGGIGFLAFIPSTEVIKTNISNMMLVVLGFYFGASKTDNKIS
jgi:Trk-type K+ transport system membrane component